MLLKKPLTLMLKGLVLTSLIFVMLLEISLLLLTIKNGTAIYAQIQTVSA